MSAKIMSTITKEAAVYALSDELSKIQVDLERAELVLYNVSEKYFSCYDRDEKEDRPKIVCEFKRNGIMMDITTDYLFKIRKALEALLSELPSKEGVVL